MAALGEQAAHTGLDREVPVDGDGAPAQFLDKAHGLKRLIARRRIVHGDVPAIAR